MTELIAVVKCPQCGCENLSIVERQFHEADGTGEAHMDGHGIYERDVCVHCEHCGNMEGLLTVEIDNVAQVYRIRPADWLPE